MRLAAAVAAALLLAAAAQAQNPSALAQLDDRGRLAFETLRLERELAALGFGLHAARFSIGYDNRITAYLDPAGVKKIAPGADKAALRELLARYADTAEKMRQVYADDDFNEVVEYHAKALLARELDRRLSAPGPIGADIGDKTVIVRYHDCRQENWDKMYNDLPVCSESLLSTSQGLVTDPLGP